MSLGDQLIVIRIAAVSIKHITGDVNVSLQGLSESSNLGVGRVIPSRGSTRLVTMVDTKGQNFRSTMIVYCYVTKLMCWFFFFYLFFFLNFGAQIICPQNWYTDLSSALDQSLVYWSLCALRGYLFACVISNQSVNKNHVIFVKPTLP